MKLLLVEPDKRLSALYQGALEAVGYKVSSAQTTQDAIMACHPTETVLILLELDVPENNGFEFLYELVSHSDLAHIPIVVLSRLPETTYEKKVVSWDELGVVEFLYKPDMTLAQLQDIVSQYALEAKRMT